ncbi:MAG: hypothetical protein DHS20C11_04640 [Lysobacteraceae bacterium]|nr:MAG: hypothetical protein DHS20C11_04640 [Xanthomonadaceae bacterium]
MIRMTVIALLACLVVSACASTGGNRGKYNRIYVGQCAVPGHWFCGMQFDSRADCNNARKKHDYETSMGGTCYSGDARGKPDTRTM